MENYTYGLLSKLDKHGFSLDLHSEGIRVFPSLLRVPRHLFFTLVSLRDAVAETLRVEPRRDINHPLRTKKYRRYLRSHYWKKARESALRSHDKCERCNSGKSLSIHHRTYARLYEEADTDLETLCQSCHYKHHKEEWEAQAGPLERGFEGWLRQLEDRGVSDYFEDEEWEKFLSYIGKASVV